MEHCNRLGWKEKFALPTSMAKEAIGIRSYNTYIKTLSELVEYGFIKMVEKSKNQYSANIIALLNFDKALDKALDKAMQKHLTKQGESTGQSNDSIIKHITNEPLTNEPMNADEKSADLSDDIFETTLEAKQEKKEPPISAAPLPKISRKRQQIIFIAPTEQEMKDYAVENNYPAEVGEKAFRHYSNGNPPWTDTNGKPVNAWKQKMQSVWFTPERRIQGQRNEPQKKQTIAEAAREAAREGQERIAKKYGLTNDNGQENGN